MKTKKYNNLVFVNNLHYEIPNMKQTLNTLKRILNDADEIGKTIRNEGQVWKAELEERQRLGLQGKEAIKHYNEWMKRYGMEHLIVK